jgi:hypothetical protein
MKKAMIFSGVFSVVFIATIVAFIYMQGSKAKQENIIILEPMVIVEESDLKNLI